MHITVHIHTHLILQTLVFYSNNTQKRHLEPRFQFSTNPHNVSDEKKYLFNAMFFFRNFLRGKKNIRNTPVRPRCIYYTGFEFLSSVTFSFILHIKSKHMRNTRKSLVYTAHVLPFSLLISTFADYNNNSPCGSNLETLFSCKWLKVFWIKRSIETVT